MADQYKSPDGQFYQMPWKSNPVMIFYNKKLFAKAGLDPNHPNLSSYAGFLAAAKKIVTTHAAKYAIYPAPSSEFFQSWYDFYSMYAAQSGGQQLIKNGRATFDNAAGRAVAGFWRQIYAHDYAGKETYSGDAFADGVAAMSIVGPWAIDVYKGKVGWGVVPVPTQSGKPSPYTFSDAKNVAMYASCENRRTAWDFLRYSTSRQQDGRFLTTTGQVPIRAGVTSAYAELLREEPGVPHLRPTGQGRHRGPQRAELGDHLATLPRRLVQARDLRQRQRRRRAGEHGTRPRRVAGEEMTTATMTPTATAAPARNRKRVLGRHPVGLLFVAPYALFIAVLFAYPLGLAVYMSFHRYIFTAPGIDVPRPFVGLDNYREALGNHQVQRAFLNILVFLVINVPLTVGLSLVLATALNSKFRGRTFFRTAYYIPYVTASVAVAGVWLFLFKTDGLVNNVLGSVAPSPSWLVNSHWAMPSIAGFVTWKQLGFFVLLYLAALQNVPKELYEAAAIDGASAWRQFRSVTVPGVRHATSLVTLLAIVTGANLFTEPYLLTGGGGPDGASASPVLLMYQLGIEQNRPDVAAAIGVVLVIGVLLLAGAQRLLDRG